MTALFQQFVRGRRSLKTQLALYFIPATLIPVIGLSYYATRIFEKSIQTALSKQAKTESELILSQILSQEKTVSAQAKKIATSEALLKAFAPPNSKAIQRALSNASTVGSLRVYSPEGDFVAEEKRDETGRPRIHYISRESLKRIKAQGLTFERYLSEDGLGLLFLARTLIQDKERLYGILEHEYSFGTPQLSEIHQRRQVEAVFLKRDFTAAISSMALAQKTLKQLTQSISLQGAGDLPYQALWIGESRYATFLFDLPDSTGRKKQWAYLGVFIPLNNTDATNRRLQLNIIYITAFLALGFGYLIFFFSNQIVRPVELLVSAMKRVKMGNLEELPPSDSSVELDYLIQAFNDMIRNVSVARKALESKIQELKEANIEIRNTQATLVQSAKMISLGQIVAGVAHELNNPVAFIYSNMHHLSSYIEKITQMMDEYQKARAVLPQPKREELERIEKELEIDFILKDMSDLTKSCLDGANRTKDIVLGLRTFSRMEESVFRPWDLHEGIQSTLRLLNAELKNRIIVHQEFEELPKVECNPNQINQVFMNLLANSAQAITGRGEIWIRTFAKGENVVIEIQDTGPGMKPDTLNHIFVPFFTTKEVGKGTGLGLSIAYGLIQKHQGTIEVESTLGEGTLFRIILPITQKNQTIKAG